MVQQDLNQNWSLTILGDNVYGIGTDPIPITIPGSVYSGLLENDLMKDPYWRDNEQDALKLMDNDFLFQETFDANKDLLSCGRILLRFEGIDTIADITLNETKLGHVENMHRVFEFDIKGILKEKDNHLQVRISSPTRFIAEADRKNHVSGTPDAMPGFPSLRKAHCMFGWDWGARLPDAGIYRPVEILGIRKARLSDNITITQKHHVTSCGPCGNTVKSVKLVVSADTEDEAGNSAKVLYDLLSKESLPSKINNPFLTKHKTGSLYSAPGTYMECELWNPEGGMRYFSSRGTITISDPELWWPNGYGRQPLYTVRIHLYDKETGEELDCVTKRIGLRTLTVDTSPYPNEKADPHLKNQVKQDQKEGSHFQFVVNGLPVFAMGADYIPEDHILQRVTEDRTRKLLSDAKDAHYNCIRVWGGGYYPNDFFYDLCDEMGLIVWQDFMFACANYELTDEFEENIRKEFTCVIRRLRHHACLGLWCGNNEMELQTLHGDWNPTRKQYYDYIRIFEYILPKILKEEDPDTFYWPSSPSSGGNFEDTEEENKGDAHYWGVWHGGDQFTAYRSHHFRFLSEFGFQSFPCRATIDSFTEPKDRNIFSEVMERHQRNTAANGKIMNYLSATYPYPKDFDSLLYCSQMLQLDAIRYGVEHFRRIRGTCMGTIVWQLNDIWPVASWSSIDYYGRWKALHYGEKRFFAPISITCEEHGRLDQKPYVNTLPVHVSYTASLHVANETGKTVKGMVNWKLLTPESEEIRTGSKSISIPPYSGVWLNQMDFTGVAQEEEMHLWYEFVQDGKVISSGSTLFVAPKHYHFADPELSLTKEGNKVTVHSLAYAKGVCIESADGNLRLSDNFFDMEKGDKTVEILQNSNEDLLVRSVYDIA